MSKNVLLFLVFISVIFFAFSGGHQQNRMMKIGCTQLNGSGCVCHDLQADKDVHVWVTGPDTLYEGQKAIYKMFLCGGPAVAGGYNVAVRFGTLDSAGFFSLLIDNELTQAFPLLFPSPQDTIYWPFIYTANGILPMDTIYSVGLSSNFDGNPTLGDYWNFGPKYPVTIIQGVTPVELTSFEAVQNGRNVNLKWETASEINNKGFEIQKSLDKINWDDLAFVQGNGSTTQIHYYSYNDNVNDSRIIYYRLKQIDFNGSYEYSKRISVTNNNLPADFVLEQNFPNPFNPSTTIRFYLPEASDVILKVFDINGKEVADLVNRRLSEGYHDVQFNSSNLASGVYIYRMQAGYYIAAKKLMLLK
jgi:Secretion system C-terminal sorting domain